MITSTPFQWDEDQFDRWPKRPTRTDPPRCARCGTDLTREPVSVLSRHCRTCLDVILKASRDE
jgi:hypothetical protein